MVKTLRPGEQNHSFLPNRVKRLRHRGISSRCECLPTSELALMWSMQSTVSPKAAINELKYPSFFDDGWRQEWVGCPGFGSVYFHSLDLVLTFSDLSLNIYSLYRRMLWKDQCDKASYSWVSITRTPKGRTSNHSRYGEFEILSWDQKKLFE